MGHAVNSKDDGAALSHRIVSEQIVLTHDPNRKACRASHPQYVLDILQSDFNERAEQNSYDRSIENELFVSKMSTTLLPYRCHSKPSHLPIARKQWQATSPEQCTWGRAWILAALQSEVYWLMSGHEVVASMINQCVSCRKIRGKLQSQQMSLFLKTGWTVLHHSRTVVAIVSDLFSPKMAAKSVSSMGCYLHAWHREQYIEVLDDLTSDSFINGLRRFVAIRGPVS